jgi:DNA-binding CsgD family transcriptional regulator
VKTLLERAYAKLGVRRRAEAVLEARRRGDI